MHKLCGVFEASARLQGQNSICDGSVQLAWDGEIYNRRMLYNMLSEQESPPDDSLTDTEIILRIYQEYGRDMVKYLQGRYAAALYDEKSGILYLWRDRFGELPLYYRQTSGTFVFSSDMRQIRALAEADTEKGQHRISPQALLSYLKYHCTVAPYTAESGVFELEPGMLMEITYEKKESSQEEKGEEQALAGSFCISRHRYYSLEFAENPPSDDIPALEYENQYDECDVVSELRSHISKAVAARLQGESRVNVLLSGGLDSSYITALAAARKIEPVYTYTLAFHCDLSEEHEKQSDVRAAEYLAKRLGTFHTTYTVTGREALASLSKIVTVLDQPFSGGVSLYWLLERVPGNQRVFLSGDGGDEAFWGYPFHRVIYDRLYRRTRSPEDKATDRAFPMPGVLPEFWKVLLKDDIYSGLADIERTADGLKEGASEEKLMQSAYSLSQRTDHHYYDILLPGQVFRYLDAFSTASDREIRSPFMDQRVVEYAAKLPAWMKLRNGRPKYLLKRVAENVLPEALLSRSKETFLPPVFLWLQKEWKEYVLDMLSYEQVEKQGMFRPENVLFLLKRFYAEPEKNRQIAEVIWSLLMLQLWLEQHPV